MLTCYISILQMLLTRLITGKDKSQLVIVNRALSKETLLAKKVCHGSVLGALLFGSSVSAMSLVTRTFTASVYAEDTNLEQTVK